MSKGNAKTKQIVMDVPQLGMLGLSEYDNGSCGCITAGNAKTKLI